MAPTLTQDTRLLQFTTPLGKDVLLISDFNAAESISHLFTLEMRLLAELPVADSITAAQLIGKPVALAVTLASGQHRFFHGIVSRFSESDEDQQCRYYQAQVVPWLWMLTLTSGCRVFENMTAPEIIVKIFQDHGFNAGRDFRLTLSSQYTKRDYCVQYRETDFNFVSRLMEDEGIFYFFEHAQDKHTLVLADTTRTLQACPGQATVPYLPASSDELKDAVTAWQATLTLTPGKYTLRDYHFEMPTNTLEVSEASVVKVGGNGKFEVYDYPGDYAEKFVETGQRLGDVFPEGEKIVRVRMEEEETAHSVSNGASYCRAFTTGTHFDLTGHSKRVNGRYVLTAINHSAVQNPYYFVGRETTTPYQNTFSCVPSGQHYRPTRGTPKPVVQGLQSAEVVGPKGEEIFTDKFGRIKVQFHWDRSGKRDEHSSAWVRVAQPWAGKQWGAIFTPRIGQEVVVDFLEGDPDRPIVVGSVYNAADLPPYPLPANQTQSGIKSRSSKGGSSENFNEIRFEDKKGQEEVYLQAERNLRTLVKASESREVGGDRTTTIGHDDTTTVKHDQKLTVQNDQTVTVQNNRSTKVGADDSETVGGNQSSKVGGSRSTQVGSSDSLSVGGSSSTTIGGSSTLTVGGSHTSTVSGSDTLTVMGSMTITCAAATTITVGSATTITSGGPVTITAPMITLAAPMVTVAGVLQCVTLMTTSVVSPVYTPGLGNLL